MRKINHIGKAALTIVLLAAISLLWMYTSSDDEVPSSQASTDSTSNYQHKGKNSASLAATTTSPLEQPKTELSPNACREYFRTKSTTVQWQQIRKAYLKKAILEWEQEGIESVVMDRVFIDSGIGLFNGRTMLLQNQSDYHLPTYSLGKGHLATGSEQLVLKSRLAQGNTTELPIDIERELISTDAYYATQNGPAYLIEYLIEAQQLSPELLEKLVDAGVLVSYSDLASLTQAGFPREVLHQAYLASGLSAEKILKSFGHMTTLSLIAIEAKNIDLAIYWTTMGSPAKPDLFYNNAIDELAIRFENASSAQVDQLFKQLADKGLQPYWPQSIDKLSRTLSPLVWQNYQQSIAVDNDPLSMTQKKKSNSLTKIIHHHILQDSVNFDLQLEPPHHCFDALGRRLTKFALHGKFKRKPSTVEPQISQKSLADSMIEEAKSIYSNDKQIEDFLGKGQTIENKEIVTRYRRQKLNEMRHTVDSPPSIESVPTELRKSLQDIFEMAHKGRWQEVEELLNELELPNEDSLNALLQIALYGNADFPIIKELLVQGAKLPSNAINWLITKNNALLAKQLLPYGLNTDYQLLGDSVLALCVKHHAPDMLALLLNSGVYLDSDSAGFDALDYALAQVDESAASQHYIALLLGAGATVEASHRQVVDAMKDKKIVLYSILIGKFPALQN